MKKEEAYRDKSGCYVAFEYDGHVFVLKTIKGTANGKTWTNPSYAFCPISSDTEFAVRFTSVEEATAAIKKVLLKPLYTQEWEVLENKNFNSFCVDKLKWKEWSEYQEVLRHKAPFAAIAVGNRVYKDTYSTALSDGSAWVFAAGEERLVGFSSRLTHKLDQLLLAIRQYPDMKLFVTEEERTEWSLKYLEEYAAKPEPAPVAKEQEVVPIGSIIDPMGESWDPDKQVYCCVAKHGVLYFPTWGKGSSCTFESESGTVLRYADNSKITGHNTYRSLCQAVLAVKAQDTFVCYTQSREGYKLFIKAHFPKEKQQELLKELPGVDMSEQQEQVVEVAPHTHHTTAVPSNSTTEPLPYATVELITDGVVELGGVLDHNGIPHGVEAASKFISLVTASPDSLVIASPDSQALTADSSIKTMKSGVTPQPSRSRIGKIAARPYEYVYDGPEQMGTTFVSRYKVDDEVWVLHEGTPRRMKITEIHPESIRGKVGVAYCFEEYTDGWGIREDKLYDTLFDLISAMTSISVEELIAAAKEVV